MPQSDIYIPSNRWLDRLTCPKCGLPMFLERVEPAEQPDHDKRHFQCTICDHVETLVVKYK
jgi:hypothetical protein